MTKMLCYENVVCFMGCEQGSPSVTRKFGQSKACLQLVDLYLVSC